MQYDYNDIQKQARKMVKKAKGIPHQFDVDSLDLPDDSTRRLFEAFPLSVDHFGEVRHLPYNGGVLSQHPHGIRVFRIIHTELHQYHFSQQARTKPAEATKTKAKTK